MTPSQKPQKQYLLQVQLPVEKVWPLQASYTVLDKPLQRANFVIISKFQEFSSSKQLSNLLEKKQTSNSSKVMETCEGDNKQAQKNTRKGTKSKDKNQSKQLASAKKNSESNLVGHYLSFFSNPQKSFKIAQLVYDNNPIFHNRNKRNVIDIFYNMVKYLYSNRQKKYLNKNFLSNCYTQKKISQKNPSLYKRIEQFGVITPRQFCIFWRFTVRYFYRNLSLMTILTSVKVGSVSRKVHIQRLRRIQNLIQKEDEILRIFGQ